MRRLLSILLLALFSLPFAAPLLAMSAAGGRSLPACCRRDGKHHCMLSMAERGSLDDGAPSLRSPLERCPFGSQAAPSWHAGSMMISGANLAFSHPQSLAAGVAQAEASWRIARDRSHQKRGPPSA